MAKWSVNHAMELGGVLLAAGLVVTVVSFTYAFADETPGWLVSYDGLVNQEEGNWNVPLMILGPILLVWGAWTIGEQIVYRRRFERLMETSRRGEFVARRRELDDVTKHLPDQYRARLKQREAEMTSRRA